MEGISVVEGNEFPYVIMEFSDDEDGESYRIGLCPTCIQKLDSIVECLKAKHPELFTI